MLLLGVAVDSTGQGLMMSNRLDLTFWNLLDLLRAVTRQGLTGGSSASTLISEVGV